MAQPNSDTQRECAHALSTGKTHQAWRMLLSHHPPCDLDRTWPIFGVNVCVRCFGMFVSFCVSLILSFKIAIPCDVLSIVLSISAMLPAGIDFTLGELILSYPRSNGLRFATGSVFGVGVGVCVSWCYSEGYCTPLLLFMVFSFIMQLVIALLFRLCGHLEEYASKYEDAVSQLASN